MRNVFLASFVAALALAATSARADEVEYPVQEKVFATGIDLEPVVTPDATYPGPRGVVVKAAPGPGLGATATSEDFQYVTDDPLPIKTAPGCHSNPAVMVATDACTCHHG
jgi:hypothetical protein